MSHGWCTFKTSLMKAIWRAAQDFIAEQRQRLIVMCGMFAGKLEHLKLSHSNGCLNARMWGSGTMMNTARWNSETVGFVEGNPTHTDFSNVYLSRRTEDQAKASPSALFRFFDPCAVAPPRTPCSKSTQLGAYSWMWIEFTWTNLVLP